MGAGFPASARLTRPLGPGSALAEISEDGHHAAVGAVGVLQAELDEDVGDVLLHRAVGDDERARRWRRSTGPRPSARAPRARAAVSGLQAGRRGGAGSAAGRRPRGRCTVPPAATRRTASRNSRDVGDPVLQQVADARRAAADAARWRSAPRRTARSTRIGQRRARARGPPARPAGPRRCSVGGIRTSTTARSGRCSSTASTRPGPSPDRGDRLDAAVGEQPDQPLAQQHGVFGDHDPHGARHRTDVTTP